MIICPGYYSLVQNRPLKAQLRIDAITNTNTTNTLIPRDLPQRLQATTGGFLANGTAFQDAFVYYADTLFKELGDLVSLWMT